jgi:release factor glutamine methyltransferase
MTIQEANKYISTQLITIYEEAEASNISDWLLENVTGIRRTDRMASKGQALSPEQAAQIDHYVTRLLANEPVQYVLNEAWFCGLKFYVDKNVLIPRPETEELVEWIISDCKFPIAKLAVMDVGSGSGCIPIAIKRRLGKAEVWGCDINPGALQVAKKNAGTLGVDVNFIEIDFLNKELWINLPTVDIVVSNPPYIPTAAKKDVPANVLHYEPYTALFVPDNDPLVFYKAIADFGKEYLNKNGAIYTEINETLGQETTAMFLLNGFKAEIKRDMQGKDRMIKATLSQA